VQLSPFPLIGVSLLFCPSIPVGAFIIPLIDSPIFRKTFFEEAFSFLEVITRPSAFFRISIFSCIGFVSSRLGDGEPYRRLFHPIPFPFFTIVVPGSFPEVSTCLSALRVPHDRPPILETTAGPTASRGFGALFSLLRFSYSPSFPRNCTALPTLTNEGPAFGVTRCRIVIQAKRFPPLFLPSFPRYALPSLRPRKS